MIHYYASAVDPSPTLPNSAPPSPPPSLTLAMGGLVVMLPVLLVVGIVLRRRHRAAQRQRCIIHLERSWKHLPHNYRRQ